MAIAKIQKANVSEEVYNQIIEAIKNGEWAPCSKLPSEVEMGEMFGVSRISVRNAVQRLVGQGVLESRHGEGTFVSDLSLASLFDKMAPLLIVDKQQIKEMYEFRSIFETGIIRLLSTTGVSEEVVQELEQNYDEMSRNKDDIVKFVNLDIGFHSILAHATNNALILNIYSAVREALLTRQLAVQKTFGTKGAMKYHKLIMDSIKDRDFEKAEKYMEEHMIMTVKNITTGVQNVE